MSDPSAGTSSSENERLRRRIAILEAENRSLNEALKEAQELHLTHLVERTDTAARERNEMEATHQLQLNQKLADLNQEWVGKMGKAVTDAAAKQKDNDRLLLQQLAAKDNKIRELQVHLAEYGAQGKSGN